MMEVAKVRTKEKGILVEVTEKDIKHGVKGDPCRCPVAKALRRATKSSVVSAGEGVLFAGPKKRRTFWRTPAFVRLFISDFDDGAPVNPFAFSLPPDSTYHGKVED